MNLQLSKLLIDTLKPSINDINVNNYPAIDNYHCNLFKFGREYILLITNDETLYSFVIAGLKLKEQDRLIRVGSLKSGYWKSL